MASLRLGCWETSGCIGLLILGLQRPSALLSTIPCPLSEARPRGATQLPGHRAQMPGRWCHPTLQGATQLSSSQPQPQISNKISLVASSCRVCDTPPVSAHIQRAGECSPVTGRTNSARRPHDELANYPTPVDGSTHRTGTAPGCQHLPSAKPLCGTPTRGAPDRRARRDEHSPHPS